MYVSIWDLDYYYFKGEKVNCFNPDVMKISSYHKQLGDIVNFITTEDDINRPYNLMYIIKEKEETPQPPIKFFMARNIRWYGKCFKHRINWKMNDAMLGCRPDYLLYPEKNTKQERAEHIRLFNNNGKPLKWVQDWTNTFRNKDIVVTDTAMWFSSKEDLCKALDRLSELKKVSFLEPIWLQKIIYDKDIREKFLKLNLKKGAKIYWSIVNLKQIDDALDFIDELKNRRQITAKVNYLRLDYRDKTKSHWEDKEQAIKEFRAVQNIIVNAKKRKIKIEVRMPKSRFETPYFQLFEEIAIWTKESFQISWLDYLTNKFFGRNRNYNSEITIWNHPEKWNEVFRDLLRQTYKDKEFLTLCWGENYISENDIPWNIWEREFKYEI